MAEDNNRKSIREVNQEAKRKLKEGPIEVEKQIVTETKDEEGNISTKTETVTTTFKAGAGAYANFFNTIADEVNRKAQKEMAKPRYRFIPSRGVDLEDNILNNGSVEAATLIKEISEIQSEIDALGYEVEIIEDLDCMEVSTQSRYYVRIANKNGVSIELDLFDYENKIKEFSFDAQEFMEAQISKITGSINTQVRKIANITVDYLSYIVYFKSLYTLTYKKIGWEYYDWNVKGWIFKYDKIYSKVMFLNGRGKSKDVEELLQVDDEDGSKEIEWIMTTINLLNKHPFDALILGAGISGLVRQLLPFTKETNININIKGKPASGKSIICHYLLGIFGNPELLEGSFTDTDNATELKRVNRPVLPYVLDDRMLKMETDSETTKRQKVLMDIFREYEGKVKERLGKQYEGDSGNRTYGPVISSSVESMMDKLFQLEKVDLGQYRRFMEFDIGDRNSGTIFKTKEEAKYIEEVAYKCYGIGIKIIIDYMFELLDKSVSLDENKNERLIQHRFNEIDKKNTEKISLRQEKENKEAHKAGSDVVLHGLDSSSKRFALIMLSYQIVREALLHYTYKELFNYKLKIEDENLKELIELAASQENFEVFCEKQNILQDVSEDIYNILEDNLVEKFRRAESTITGSVKDINKNLYKYISKNTKHFLKVTKFESKDLKKLYDLEDDLLGCYEEGEKGIILYGVANFALTQFWEMKDIPSADVILKYCKEVKEAKLTPAKALDYGNVNYSTIRNIHKAEYKNTNNKLVDGKQIKFDERFIEKQKEGNSK